MAIDSKGDLYVAEVATTWTVNLMGKAPPLGDLSAFETGNRRRTKVGKPIGPCVLRMEDSRGTLNTLEGGEMTREERIQRLFDRKISMTL